MRTFYFKRDPSYDREYGNKSWLYINNCGYYLSISQDIVTVRDIPRSDYHLLYVSNGEIQINGVSLTSGDAYLYNPNEPHKYTYKKVENSRYYWIHFTGNKAAEILSHCELSRGINRTGGHKQEKDTLFAMLTEELIGCADEASDFATSLFFSFLSLFKGNKSKKRLYDKALCELESNHDDVSISKIASSYNVTPSHFIRSFKEIYGMTPNEYRQNYRISKAMNFLKLTNLSIQEIANQCGFIDPFYFSRIFKKRVGASPLEYRKQK